MGTKPPKTPGGIPEQEINSSDRSLYIKLRMMPVVSGRYKIIIDAYIKASILTNLYFHCILYILSFELNSGILFPYEVVASFPNFSP